MNTPVFRFSTEFGADIGNDIAIGIIAKFVRDQILKGIGC